MVIGSFQILNLIRNKIPFMLVAVCSDPNEKELILQDFKKVFGPVEKIYLDRILRFADATAAEFLKTLQQESQVKKDSPIVFIGRTDELSKPYAQYFQDNEFVNAYYVIGGSAELHLE